MGSWLGGPAPDGGGAVIGGRACYGEGLQEVGGDQLVPGMGWLATIVSIIVSLVAPVVPPFWLMGFYIYI